MFREHAVALFEALYGDTETWRFLPTAMPCSPDAMQAWVDAALDECSRGARLPFTVALDESGAVAGSTSMLAPSESDRHIEIGWTWYGPAFRRTAVNTECKYLLLRHAFETLGCIRVFFKTDMRNERSQAAIERLGAVREGVLRRDRIVKDGYQRSSVYYSILEDEWPSVKTRLETMLER